MSSRREALSHGTSCTHDERPVFGLMRYDLRVKQSCKGMQPLACVRVVALAFRRYRGARMRCPCVQPECSARGEGGACRRSQSCHRELSGSLDSAAASLIRHTRTPAEWPPLRLRYARDTLRLRFWFRLPQGLPCPTAVLTDPSPTGHSPATAADPSTFAPLSRSRRPQCHRRMLQ